MLDALVLKLQADAPGREVIGGKGEGLARLMRAGLPVPPTFCVTASAFQFVTRELAHGARSLSELTERILEAPLPAPLVEQIEAALGDLSASRFAVRSSAIDEDSDQMSMAGQQLTVLDVQGLDDVLDAIRRVWASLYDMDSLLYRAEFDARHEVPAGIAVLLQPMLAPECAGVLFTSGPLGNTHEAVVTAAAGLGTTVVDGSGEDTTYYLERPNGYVRKRTGEGRPLSGEQLAQLARLADRVEALCGAPQDIEWAYQPSRSGDPRLALLQMRPITHYATDQQARTVWTNANVGEALPGVGSPMTWSIIHRFSTRGFEQAFSSLGLEVPEESVLVGSFRGRVYLNLSEFMSIASGIPILRPEVLFSVAGGGGVELVKDIYERRSARDFIKKLPLTIPRIIASQAAMPLIAPWWEGHFSRECEDFFMRDLERLNHAQLARQLDDVDALFERTGLIMLAGSSNFLMSYIVMREALRLMGGDKALAHERLMVSGIDFKSAEPGRALLELGRLARRSLRLRKLITGGAPGEALTRLRAAREHDDVAEFLEELRAFREAYGHRAPREAELTTPRWREDTTFIFEVVRGFIQAPGLPSERDVASEREALHASIEAVIRQTFGSISRPLFRLILSTTRHNAARRESLRALVVDSLDMYRRYFLECGRRMVSSGQLLTAQDVFFLNEAEVRAWLADPGVATDFMRRVLVRRAVHDAQAERPDPPGTFLLRGRQVIGEEELVSGALSDVSVPANSRALAGLPGSSGRATGRARVLRDPGEECAIEHGDVLVVPYADVGWTPLFLSASAVVMGLGGPLSHACIVAREFGIPTVVNARGATEMIQDGDRVTVDGDAGFVFVHE